MRPHRSRRGRHASRIVVARIEATWGDPLHGTSASTWFALIGDVVGSRHLQNRAQVQRQLQGTLAELNRELVGPGEDGTLVAPLKLTAGDEIQGLLRRPAPAVDIVVRIADGLHPATVAWGLGAGPLATDLGEDVALLDGPCFHRARSAVQAAYDDGAWVRAEGFPPPLDGSISALFRLMGAVRSRWKPAQVRYIRSVRGHLQKEVAEMHDVDASTVSKALQAARFRDVEEGEAAARRLLEWGAASLEAKEGTAKGEKGR
jgi:hypothetical protein